MSSIVAIVGRPNVGKSTLFNRLVQRREAIVDSVSGVTRDRHYGKSDWNGKEFSVIDTGGYIVGSDDIFEGEIRKQVQLAIEESDIIVFVVDVEEGITPMDAEVAKILRKVKKPIFIAVNKVDNAMRDADAVEFYNLGLGDYHTISSINGSGTGDILDAIVAKMPEPEAIDLEKEELPRFAVVGRPNAGKSSFINSCRAENLEPNIVFTARNVDIIKTYVKRGFGVGIIASMAFEAKSDRDLIGYSTKEILPRCTTWLAFNKNLFLRKYMKDFIQLFAPHISERDYKRYLFQDNLLPPNASNNEIQPEASRLPMHEMWHI